MPAVVMMRPPEDESLPAPADPAPLPPSGRAVRPGTAVAIAGGIALAVALGAYFLNLASHPLTILLGGNDLVIYRDAGLVARRFPAVLYSWQLSPGVRFTYTPFAALIFGDLSLIPWLALKWIMAVASIAALPLTVWLTFGQLGWRGKPRLGVVCTVTAVAFWSDPVQRTLHLGQVELLLMLLVVWDLGRPRHNKWKGAGIGVAAGIKLVPLIFIPYLVLTRQFRQAAVATAAFAMTVAAGFARLPSASVQWWLGPDFLRAGRTGFVGFMANQSLRGLISRLAGSVTAATPLWLVVAAATAVIGLIAAALFHRSGRPVQGWVTCALTGQLVSPVSWDYHWVWLAPIVAVLVDAAIRAQGADRWAWWAGTAMLGALFGAWPSVWNSNLGISPWGLIWYAHSTHRGVGDHPWDAEYHWHGLAWFAGNLYILLGLALFAGLLAAAWLASRGPAAPLPGDHVFPVAAEIRPAAPARRQHHCHRCPGPPGEVPRRRRLPGVRRRIFAESWCRASG
jgi:alpha-1,2-mannosyltransferase